jgi:hypothetical protein
MVDAGGPAAAAGGRETDELEDISLEELQLAARNVQPLDQSWNAHGFANTMTQRVPVTVRPPTAPV